MFLNRLRLLTALAALVISLVAPCLARTRKADKLLKQAEEAEARKDYEAAVDLYDKALQISPNDPGYQLAERRARFHGAELHTSEGVKLRNQQKLQEALVEFQKAYLLDPSYSVSLQEIRNTEQMVREKMTLPAGAPALTPIERAQKAIESRVNALGTPPELRPLTNTITNLKMNNQSTKVLYETVGKLAGINVLFDNQGLEQGSRGNFNIDLNRVTLSEALDYVALLTHTFWKPISSNAIFVTVDSQPKRQEYQDQVVKVFYIQNATAQAEFTELFNAVRTGANLNRGLIQLPTQNALIVRGTPDQVAIAEKIIHDLDRPRSEVLIDVLVLETSKSKTRTLAAALAGATNGLNVPILFTPRNPVLFGTNGSGTGTTGSTTGTTGSTTGTSSTGSGSSGIVNTGTTGTTGGSTTQALIALSKVGKISTNDFSINLPGALIEAMLQDQSTRVLQRPQLRATDGGKASLKIGSKIPYVSGSLNSAIATPGAIPYATTQFQQVDVGVNIDVQPHVNGPDDVSLHLKVEISNVTGNENIGGIEQPIIGQRVNEADVRLRNGEVSILGGLTQRDDSKTNAGIPGLVNMPVLGYFFGTKTRSSDQSDILIALIPHIIRQPDLTLMGEEPIQSGSENNVRVQHAAPGGEAGPPQSNAAPQAVPTPPASPSKQPVRIFPISPEDAAPQRSQPQPPETPVPPANPGPVTPQQ
jgi:general secretion pathway protein D